MADQLNIAREVATLKRMTVKDLRGRYTGTPMRIAGWRYPVVVDLAGMSIPSQKRPIRFSHDPGSGVGHTDSIRIDSGTLVATGLISRDTPIAREVVVSSKNGFPWQASIGSSVDEYEFIKEGQTVSVNGQTFKGPLNVVRKATLGEISFVDLGADGQTSVRVAAAHPPGRS
ncbi:MAG: HK97 family phage prohead protease [Phycisphaeraceae bacterium]|nr:HK97 family phage prohead protease [Phycisphaeraceae bacterium]